MKMSRLFTTVFDSTMKEQGYRRKGKLYYRLHGEMLQGVVLKAINPYFICFTSYPVYWVPILTRAEYGTEYPKHEFAKGYWAEDSIWELGVGEYYREENEQMNIDYMNACLRLAKQFILPLMDEMTDMDDLLQYDYDYVMSATRRVARIDCPELEAYWLPYVSLWKQRIYPREHQLMWLYQAYRTGRFCEAYESLKKIHLEMEKMDRIQPNEDFETCFSLFHEKMQANDLNWIEELRQKRKAWLLPRLRDELGIIVI